MKKILFLLALLPAFVFGQNTFTVSNVPGVTADFATLQGAIDTVAAGSTLLVFPGGPSYGDAMLTKKLSIYGTGYLLDQNSEPFVSPNETGVILNRIIFNPGSDNSYIEGLQFIDNFGTPNVNRIVLDSVANVIISRCETNTRGFGPPQIGTYTTLNCTFRECYFVPRQPDAGFDASGGSYYQEYGNGSQNLQFRNNIFDSRGGTGTGLLMNYNVPTERLGTVTFDRNTILLSVGNTDFCNYTYTNNIFYNTNPTQTFNAANLRIHGAMFNNVVTASVSNLFPPNSGNIIGVNPDSLFIYSTFGYHSLDSKWGLQNNHPAKTYATDGGEVGAFGGINHYVLSGISSLPGIYAITISADTTIRGNVLVRVRGKAAQ